ncbi:MAG: hypothetical protein HC821_04035 [Lewinella sp.]|nr:hypothetical protein [Lewinella sp.]
MAKPPAAPQPREDVAARKSSSFKLLLWIILGFLLLSFFLQQAGVGIVRTNTEDSIIQRPHD